MTNNVTCTSKMAAIYLYLVWLCIKWRPSSEWQLNICLYSNVGLYACPYACVCQRQRNVVQANSIWPPVVAIRLWYHIVGKHGYKSNANGLYDLLEVRGG